MGHNRFMSTLHRLHDLNQASIVELLRNNEFRLQPPPERPDLIDDIDKNQVRFWSDLAEQSNWCLPQVVRLLRGQTEAGLRPNKDLYEIPMPVDPALKPTVLEWNKIVGEGIRPQWSTDLPAKQATHPQNHTGLQAMAPQIRRHLRRGQLEGRYLIVESQLLEQWPEVLISPLGAVEKSGSPAADIWLINDYSIPDGYAVNDYTDRENFPSISYNPPRDIATRIHHLTTSHIGECVLMMLGDVSGAFRHIPIHSEHVHMFAFVFENYLVIDLSCGFGWCGSPAFYSIAGTIINALYEHGNKSTRQFSGNVWCDDHTCIEVAKGTVCFDANISLASACNGHRLGTHSDQRAKIYSMVY